MHLTAPRTLLQRATGRLPLAALPMRLNNTSATIGQSPLPKHHKHSTIPLRFLHTSTPSHITNAEVQKRVADRAGEKHTAVGVEDEVEQEIAEETMLHEAPEPLIDTDHPQDPDSQRQLITPELNDQFTHSVFDLIQMLPRVTNPRLRKVQHKNGYGLKFTRKLWEGRYAEPSFWTVTRYKPAQHGHHQKVWGVLHWRGKTDGRVQRIASAHKPEWKIVPEADWPPTLASDPAAAKKLQQIDASQFQSNGELKSQTTTHTASNSTAQQPSFQQHGSAAS